MTETIPQPRTAAADHIEDGAPESAKPGLLVLAPLRLEANAVRRGLTNPTSRVLQTGVGAARARRSAGKRQPHPFGAMVVMGTAAGLGDDLSPGDLVVASEVTDGETTVALPGAGLLAAELRRAGLSARAGRLITVPKLVKSADRLRLATGGYLAADMETAALLGAADGRPVAVIRAVSDTGLDLGILRPGMVERRDRGFAGAAQGGAGRGEVGRRLPRAHRAARRAAVVLRGRRAGHRDRGAGA